MIVSPQRDELTGTVTANTTFLCPSFEAERARLLGMPFDGPIQIVPWEEHWNPYVTLQQANVFSGLQRVPRLMVDEEMRDFIQRGLGKAGFDVVGLKGQVEEVRQIKSDKEVEILRAVNTGTVEAVRQIRKCTDTIVFSHFIHDSPNLYVQVYTQGLQKMKLRWPWIMLCEPQEWSLSSISCYLVCFVPRRHCDFNADSNR